MTDAIGLFLAVMVVLCCAAIWSVKALWLALWLVAVGLAWLAVRKWWTRRAERAEAARRIYWCHRCGMESYADDKQHYPWCRKKC